ncbi:hypothetical protein TNCV_70621 [Trichonephila clavipes]|nr:hypothetical protein TNCV_70621 [Trichonephila clavipes]
MVEVGWPAWRVARQAFTRLTGLTLTVRRCWDQWAEEASFTRRPGSVRPRQSSHQDDCNIIRHARARPLSRHRQHLHDWPLCLPEPSKGTWLKYIWYRGAYCVCCQ